MSQAFAIIASCMLVFVIALYFKQVVTDDSVPNPATWFIWAVATSLNAVTYFAVLKGDLFKALISFVIACGSILVFVYAFSKGKFSKLGLVEFIALILCIGIGVFWQTSGDDIYSNLALQFILVISFIPTVRKLLKGEAREKTPPWLLAVFAYACQIIALLLDWRNQHWSTLAYPFVNGVLGNGTVAAVVILQSHGYLKPKRRITHP